MRAEEQAELRRKDVALDEMTIRVRMAAPELITGRRAPGDAKSEAGETMVRAGQSPEKAALIHQHSDLERQQEVESGLDNLRADLVRGP